MKSTENLSQNSKICPKCFKEYPKKFVSCEDCNVTLMKKTTFQRTMADNMALSYVCPKCHTRIYPPIKSKICEKCKVELLSDSEYTALENTKTQKFNKRFNTTILLFFSIGAIAVIWFFATILSSPAPNHTYTCSRCGTTFTDSTNKKSIAYSGYCKKCHDDVEFILDVSEALENK